MPVEERYYIPLLIGGTILFVVFLFFIITYVIVHTRRLHLDKLKTAKLLFDHHQSLLVTRLEEQERVMAQISREIHDNVSQKIDFIQMNVKAMAEPVPGMDVSKFIDNCQSLLAQVANELRNLSYSLSSDYIKSVGLVEVLSREVSFIESVKLISCRLNVYGSSRTCEAETELILFRIAQEAIHNALKHARPTAISINVSYAPDSITVEIIDDGRGFDTRSEAARYGLGLKNMQHRAAILNARLEIESAPNVGCVIRATVSC